VGTRPDCVDETTLDLLEDFSRRGLVWIEYGLQSVHNTTLERINRGHDFGAFETAVSASRRRNLNICAHIILGLPGESPEDMLETARTIAQMDIQGVKLHLLYVVKGTPLAGLYQSGAYRCLEQQEYVSLICRFLELLPRRMVIQRLTGDPHPDELMAPDWSMRKTETLNQIRELLERENSWQGKMYPG
jgi:radical SAM protein (TIGR01212 family)